jgi:hypothetical protein
MRRTTFLTLIGGLGLVIGLVALFLPSVVMAGKGVDPAPAPTIWVREVGVLILGLSLILLLVRREPDSPMMRAIFCGNALVHAGLLPIELLAWNGGVITRFSGIAPNSALHLFCALAFAAFTVRARSARM